MNHFINLKISKSQNILLSNNKIKIKNFSPFNSQSDNSYHIILNNLISFLYKKLTPFLFQEVKNYLNIQFSKLKSKFIKENKSPNTDNNEIIFNKANDNKNSIKEIRLSLKDIKNRLEFTNKSSKTKYTKTKKDFLAKSEKKKNYSKRGKYKTFEKKKEIKNLNILQNYKNKDINDIKSFMNNQLTKAKNKKNKKFSREKKNKEHIYNNSKDNSFSDSRDKISIYTNNNIINNINNNSNNKKYISNIILTSRKYSLSKNNLLNKNKKNYISSKKKNHLTKNHPLLNERLLYQFSFINNNIENINIKINNNTYYNKNKRINSSLKNFKNNNIKINQGTYVPSNFSKNKNSNSNKTIIIKNPFINTIISKTKSNANKSNSIINNLKTSNTNVLDLNYNNLINGGENINCKSPLGIHSQIKSNYELGNEKIEGNRNFFNKKYKLLNEEMMEKIKSTLDDNLKGMFNFSYENFLSKESEPESKEYSINKDKENYNEEYFEERNCSDERL